MGIWACGTPHGIMQASFSRLPQEQFQSTVLCASEVSTFAGASQPQVPDMPASRDRARWNARQEAGSNQRTTSLLCRPSIPRGLTDLSSSLLSSGHGLSYTEIYKRALICHVEGPVQLLQVRPNSPSVKLPSCTPGVQKVGSGL